MRCPVCKAQVDSATCRRCRADLTLLFRLEEERGRLGADAAYALLLGQAQEALTAAGAMESLRPGADALRLRALALLLQRDFFGAYWAHGEATAAARET